MAKYLDGTGLTYLWGKITAAFQPKITASGLLKGDGSGGVTAATAGTDYQAAGNYMRKDVDYVTAGKKSGTTLGTKATAEGINTTASGQYSHAEGYGTTASGERSHAEGSASKALNAYSHAEGCSTTLGLYSHAEGNHTLAYGGKAHAEGSGANYAMNLTGSGGATTYTVVSSEIPPALFSYIANNCYMMDDAGNNLRKITSITLNAAETAIESITLDGTLKASAVTNWPFAPIFVNAKGGGSHSEGLGTIAQDQGSHAGGKYNIPTAGAEVIGGGTLETPANIRTLDWSGNEWIAGKLTVGSGPTNNMDVATKQYVDTAAAPEVFTVKITVSNNSDTADKSISDIYAAYTAGKLCVAEYISANDIYGTAFITRIGSDFVRFEGLFFEPYSRPSKLIFDGEIYNGTDTWLSTVQNLPNWYDVTATTGMLKGDSSGRVRAAVADTDYMAARSITNNTTTSTSITANTNLITANTLRYHTNRTTSVAAADTNYSTVMARGIYAGTSAMTAGTTSLTNGVIYLQYDA